MRDAVLEGERVDEGLQGRTGRAKRQRHVDGAGALAVHEVGTADLGKHLAGAVVDDEDRRRELRVEALQTVADESFECGLLASSDGQPMHPGAGVPDRRLGRVGGDRREGPPPRREGLGLGGYRLRGREKTLGRSDIEHAIAGPACRLGIAVRPARLGRLRQRDEERGFGEGEPLRLAPEICEARGAGAFEIAAVRREREVEPQDLGLRQPPLQFDGPRDLAQFRAHAPFVPRLEEARHLHGQRRTARDDAALPQELCAGPGERPQVDAAMLLEAVILVGFQHAQEMRVDISRLDRQSPSPVRRGEGPEETAVAVEHDGRMVRSRGEIERFEAS